MESKPSNEDLAYMAKARTGYSSPQTPGEIITPSEASTFISVYSEQELSNGVAVIGLACRVAGGNDSPEKLWQFMIDRQDASGEIPPMRWEPYRRRDARNAKILDKTTSRGYFVDNLDDFDATFFGISPKEAEQMDPQQRVSLEVAWEALERAGIAPQKLSGSDTSVFWGVNSDDFSKLVLEDLENVEAWMGIGTAYCGIPNRISYQLNLMGPSTAVDAACASGLVAIHHGRQSILLKESEISIVGGVNALYGPGLTRVLDKAGAVSPEGRCRSFDDSAHGYGRGEGAGAIILKDLRRAIEDGDNILAVLKGSAVAQDGRTNGIMAPNARAQEIVARKALKEAGIDSSTVHYVEAHATSTPLGDPTEISAISAVYGKSRSKDDPCYVGSVKPNIGHLEAGAGAMGFIKAVLSMQYGIIPPQANLQKLNSKVDWSQAGVKIPKEATKWPKPGDIRRAAICSYGYGGTVSHAVIEERPHQPITDLTQLRENQSTVLLLSAPQQKRIAIQAQDLHDWLKSRGDQDDLGSIASTLARRRTHHDHRAALIVDSYDDALEALSRLSKGSTSLYSSQSRALSRNTGAVWVFSGHGAQWKDMGKDLLQDPVFLSAITPLNEIAVSVMDFSAIEALRTGDFETTDRIQVLTYVMQIGISAILHRNGVSPQAVIGHSVGEIAASVVAGALTPVEGALVVCHRAMLYRRVAGLGSMALVSKPFSDVSVELLDRKDVVAAIDASVSSCVVSGNKDAVAELAASWRAEGTQVFNVKSDVAFHSPMLLDLVAPLRHALHTKLSPRTPHTKLYTTAEPDSTQQKKRDADYWVANMINPVHLTPAVQAALRDGQRVFLEISAHPIVSQSINETVMEAGIEDYAVISTLNKKRGSPQKDILDSIAQLHCRGIHVEWQKLTPRSWAIDVPTTKWLHKTFIRKIETGPLNASLTHDVDKHTLLGQRMNVAGTSTVVYSTKLDDSTKPFPGNHPLHGTEIVPAAALVNTFYHATRATEINDIILRVPVAISAPREVQIVMDQDSIKITSRLTQSEGDTGCQDHSWVTHTTGCFDSETIDTFLNGSPAPLDISSIRSRINTRMRDDFSMEYLDKVGVSAMGFPWKITEHWGNTKEMLARVDVSPTTADTESLPWDANSWAPILDAATSVGSTVFFDEPRLRMPAQIEKVNFYTHSPPPKTGYLFVERATDSALASHVTVTDDSGAPVAKFTSMRFSEIEGTPGISGSVESLVHQIAWPPSQLSEMPLDLRSFVLVSTDAQAIAKHESLLLNKFNHSSFPTASDVFADTSLILDKYTAIVFIPGNVESVEKVPSASEAFIGQLLQLVKGTVKLSSTPKIFVITKSVAQAATPTSLAQSPLHGLSRIIASEQPEVFGGLFDIEDGALPLSFMRYVRDADVVRVQDGVPRTARLRPLPRDKLLPAKRAGVSLVPKPEGTYLITGGFGALGLEVANFLVEKGARRIVLVSRRALPPRKRWNTISADDSNYTSVIAKIRQLEASGASVYSIAVDIAADDATTQLSQALEALSLPRVAGVVHAAGVLEDELILNSTMPSYSRVLAPKIRGALALHAMYPPSSSSSSSSSDDDNLDFFMLFSSCGQLFGFPGQGSYASGNAFLDALATHRRAAGDAGSIAFQWTSWRGLGMAASTEFINAELTSKGITDVTCADAFRAWMHAARFDTDHAVVLRALSLGADDLLPAPILADIAPRTTAPSAAVTGSGDSSATGGATAPPSGPELRVWLEQRIMDAVASVLQSTADDLDPRTALSDLGIDSVMTVTLRAKLQAALKIRVPPTLTWSHPTVGHLVGWFTEKMNE